MKLLWGVLCSRIITDSETNTVSYIDCIEEIQVPSLPFNIPVCSIGSLWEKTANNGHLKVRIIAEEPSGQSKQIFETDDLEVTKDRHRLNFLLNGFPLKNVGKYNFKIEMLEGRQWKLIFEVGFKVNINNKKKA